MYQLTSSIVLYNNKESEVRRVIECVLQTNLRIKLFLIDNSETDNLKSLSCTSDIEYIFNNKNLGYGKAHNISLRKSISIAPYHLVLNPDVEFEAGVLENIYSFMQQHPTVGQLMPKVFYKNGQLQKLCNPLPKPINLASRRFFLHTKWAQQLNANYELKGFNYDRVLNVPNLSGCFMFLRNETLRKAGLFDERYFMYMEDIDLCRRVHAISKTIFYPEVSIIHGFEKESYSSTLLLKHHISSAIKYFNKWGWIIDKQRDEFNNNLLQSITNHRQLVIEY